MSKTTVSTIDTGNGFTLQEITESDGTVSYKVFHPNGNVFLFVTRKAAEAFIENAIAAEMPAEPQKPSGDRFGPTNNQ